MQSTHSSKRTAKHTFILYCIYAACNRALEYGNFFRKSLRRDCVAKNVLFVFLLLKYCLYHAVSYLQVCYQNVKLMCIKNLLK